VAICATVGGGVAHFLLLGLVSFPRSPSRVRLCAVKYSMSERGREERARRLEGRVRGEQED
jgi:hypothetical protein